MNVQIDDAIFRVDAAAQARILMQKPWQRDPLYFKQVRVNILALLKMLAHANAGGSLEVMGILQGKIDGDAIVVSNVFELPVTGTETRVNAQAEAYEFMVEQVKLFELTGQKEKVVGWYHSHPGYGCWLSKIDIDTQNLNQQFQDPFIAIVVDPKKSLLSGKVQLRAFRTFQDYHHPGVSNIAGVDEDIPSDKIDEFGAHANKYYQLAVSFAHTTADKTMLDALNSLGAPETNTTTIPWAEEADRINIVVDKMNNGELQLCRNKVQAIGEAALARLIKRTAAREFSEQQKSLDR